MDDESRNDNNEVINDEVDTCVNDSETKAEEYGESKAMTEEEIRAAAENIGASPYAGYESRENSYSSYTNYDYSTSSDAYNRAPEVKKPSVFKRIMRFVGLAAAFGMIAGGTFFGVSRGLNAVLGENSFLQTSEEATEKSASTVLKQLGVSNLVIANTSTTEAKSFENNAVVDVVKENMPSTVCVNVSYTATQRDFFTGRTTSYEVAGGGSGFIVGENDEEVFIATNHHVIEKAEKVTVTFSSGDEVEGTVKASDSNLDLAVVSVKKSAISGDTLLECRVATLGNSDESQVGEMVIAIGNALGYGQSVTVGYLSAKDREITTDGVTKKLLQTDAAINSGNSGGPLFNVKGEVIGINCAKFSDSSIEGMCFAIPISAAIPILDDLINREVIAKEDQGYLGVSLREITEDIAELLGMPSGLRVQGLIDGKGAQQAGIYVGDILTGINGKSLPDYNSFVAEVSSFRYGTQVTVNLKRMVNGEWTDMAIEVTLSKRE